MLHRNFRLKWPAETIREEITLAPGETKQVRIKAWLAEKLAPPRFCSTHPQTRLVPDRSHCEISQAYTDSYGYPVTAQIKPGVFDFRATLRCPACRCAYALCPPEFHTTSFETFVTDTPERAATLARSREFAAQVNCHECGFAAFLGRPGPGKTRLACNIIGALENPDALYVRHGALTTALRATYGRKDVFLHRRERSDEAGDDEPPTPLEIVQTVGFLVLDEIGANALANDERLMLDELIKHRYDQHKPTILISNLPLDQFKEFLGDALHDRIREAAGGGKFILQFEGGSFRLTTGENYLAGLG